MIIIPAIDIIAGKCVRLTKGDFESKKIYHEDPLSMAKEFEAHGIKRLHLVDLDGARAGKVQNWHTLERIAAETSLDIDFSGGLSNREALKRAFDSGATYLAIGSMAVKQPELVSEWIASYGADKFIIGADVSGEKIMVNGWQARTEKTWSELIGYYVGKGIHQYFCTDIDKDGLLAGPSVGLYEKNLAAFPSLQLIASGGVSSVRDLRELRSVGCSAAIVGKAIYEGKILLKELNEFIS